MPSRLKRYQTEGHFHFITFSCYRRLPYLNNNAARIVTETLIETLRQRHGFYLFGYVLMPEHVHLLMSEPKRQPLSRTMNVLKTEISKKLKGERKQFWQRRYYDFNVLTHAKFVEKLRYMHRNPWSSFRHYLTGEEGRVEIESHWTWSRRERSSPHP